MPSKPTNEEATQLLKGVQGIEHLAFTLGKMLGDCDCDHCPKWIEQDTTLAGLVDAIETLATQDKHLAVVMEDKEEA